MNQKAIDYINRTERWQTESIELRSILLECGLEEEFKWSQPCYMFKQKNIVMLGNFKDSIRLSFFKGVLLHDSEKLLRLPGENSQSVKMFCFTSLEEIALKKNNIKQFVYEALELEKMGAKVEKRNSDSLVLPEELARKLNANKELAKAFAQLSPGRQRAYAIHINGAKQSKTKIDRIEKSIPNILKGSGLNDCTCGLSKRMPACDGSHRQLR